jgi:hypothetical protein
MSLELRELRMQIESLKVKISELENKINDCCKCECDFTYWVNRRQVEFYTSSEELLIEAWKSINDLLPLGSEENPICVQNKGMVFFSNCIVYATWSGNEFKPDNQNTGWQPFDIRLGETLLF